MSTNPHTGDKLRTKPSSRAYADNWELIFGKKEEPKLEEGITVDEFISIVESTEVNNVLNSSVVLK
jgi:hypothetical protein